MYRSTTSVYIERVKTVFFFVYLFVVSFGTNIPRGVGNVMFLCYSIKRFNDYVYHDEWNDPTPLINRTFLVYIKRRFCDSLLFFVKGSSGEED